MTSLNKQFQKILHFSAVAYMKKRDHELEVKSGVISCIAALFIIEMYEYLYA